MKLLIAVPAEGSVPLLEFFGLLDEKQRQKLLSLFALLLQSPAAVMREPYVKHFCIERYQALYELRAKSKNLVRIIFTLTDDGDILFLTPFIKRHKRNTMQALDRSLDCLTHIRDGSCSTQELSIKFFLKRRYHSMTKHKFIWAGLAIGVPALVLALWKGWWCKV